MKSIFYNWYKSHSRRKRQDLSKAFPVYVSGIESNITIKFENEYGKRIVFNLNSEDSKLFLDQIERIKSKSPITM